MDIPAAASNTGISAATTTAARTATSDRPVVSEDFRTFIDLLTVQVRNQDPTAPLDSAQFVEQLATFSGLEQQANTNQKLDTVSEALAQISFNTQTNRIENETAANTVFATFTGRDIGFQATPAPAAATTAATVKDENGTIIRTLLLNNSAEGSYAWNGRDNNGKEVAHGLYSITITNLDTDGKRLGSSAPSLDR